MVYFVCVLRTRQSPNAGAPDCASRNVDEWRIRDTFLHRLDPRAKIVALFSLYSSLQPRHLLFSPALPLAGVAYRSTLPVGAVLLRGASFYRSPSALLIATVISGRPNRCLILLRSYLSAVGRRDPARLHAFALDPRRSPPHGRPAVLLDVIQFVYRYLLLIGEQSKRMAVAASARGARRSFAAVAGSIGVLFARSYDRADAVHRAMLARGYAGSLMSRAPLRL